MAVWDGAFLQLWVNGALAGEALRLGAWPEAPVAPILIGQGFKGLIDEVRLYDRPLAESEIRAHGQGGWPAMNSCGWCCQPAMNRLTWRNNTGPTGG